MFEFTANTIIDANKILAYYDMASFKIKSYVLLVNDNDDGHSFNYVEKSRIGYPEIYNANDLLNVIRPTNDEYTLVGNGYDSLSMSNEKQYCDPVLYTDTECNIIVNPTDNDIIDNIPYFKDVIIFYLDEYKEFSERRESAVLSVILEFTELVNKERDVFIICKRGKTIYYI